MRIENLIKKLKEKNPDCTVVYHGFIIDEIKPIIQKDKDNELHEEIRIVCKKNNEYSEDSSYLDLGEFFDDYEGTIHKVILYGKQTY